jgi:hypothetical protein
MAGKRHHFLPRFLLRRFAATAGPQGGLIWRAGLDGSMRAVAPKFEAAKKHYYAPPPELNLPVGYIEDVLARVEDATASAINKVERGGAVTRDDRDWLALFLLLQHRRTPKGRADLRFMDEFIARQEAELRISNTDAVRRLLAKEGRRPTADEVEAWQRDRLAELEAGELVIESTPDREVALMFSQLPEVTRQLVENFDWQFVTIPSGGPELVLPDVGLTMYDPTPKFDGAGTGFASSPRSETVLYLSAHLVLVIRPGEGSGARVTATHLRVEEMNRRAIACSDRCIYAASEAAALAAMELANSDPKRMQKLQPRPPTIWIAESHGDPKAGPTSFLGHSRTGTLERVLHVSQEGIDEAREHAAVGRSKRRRRRRR